MSASTFLAALADLRARHGVPHERLAAAAGIPIEEVSRIERGDADVGLLTSLRYAAAAGGTVTLGKEQGGTFTSGDFADAVAAEGDLEALRGCFAACRKAADLTPTALARFCNLAVKVVLALERGPSGTRVSTAATHAARFGLVLTVVPRGRGSTPSDLAAHVEANLSDIYDRIGSETKSLSSHHMKTPRSAMEAAIADVLARAFVSTGVKARVFARSIDVDWKTIAPGGIPSFTGRFGTTARAASALGFRVVAVPAGLDLGGIVDEGTATPPIEPDLGDAQALALAAAFRDARVRGRLSTSEIERRGGGSVQTIKVFADNPRNSTLANLCRHAEALDLRLVAVPEGSVEEVLKLAGAAPLTARPKAEPARKAFCSESDTRKREIMDRIHRAILDATPVRPASGTGKFGYRIRIADLCRELRSAGVVLEFVDDKGVPFAAFGRTASGPDEFRAFVDRSIALRHARSLTLEMLGARVGLGGKRMGECEKASPKTLASSVVIYGEALGLTWRVSASKGTGRTPAATAQAA